MIYNGCLGCQHYQWNGDCPAFLGGRIPMDIASGEFEHTRPHPQQIDQRLWAPRTPEREVEIRTQLAEHMRTRNG